MGSGHRGVHADLPGDQPFGVGSGRQGGEDLAPGAVALPAAKQPVHRLPRPVAGRHIPPRRPGPGPPADPIDQLPLAPGGWPAGLLAGGQQRLQPGPLFVGEVASSPARSISRGISTFETGPRRSPKSRISCGEWSRRASASRSTCRAQSHLPADPASSISDQNRLWSMDVAFTVSLDDPATGRAGQPTVNARQKSRDSPREVGVDNIRVCPRAGVWARGRAHGGAMLSPLTATTEP